MAPGGRQPYCMEKIKTQRLPAPKKAIKPQPQCVRYSAAASGLLTRPDNGCSYKSAWHHVQCAAVLSTPTQGVGQLGREPPP